MTSAFPASTASMASRRPFRCSSGVPPETSSSSIVLISRSLSRLQASRIRSRCSTGEAKDSPSRPLVSETRTMPIARRVLVVILRSWSKLDNPRRTSSFPTRTATPSGSRICAANP